MTHNAIMTILTIETTNAAQPLRLNQFGTIGESTYIPEQFINGNKHWPAQHREGRHVLIRVYEKDSREALDHVKLMDYLAEHTDQITSGKTSRHNYKRIIGLKTCGIIMQPPISTSLSVTIPPLSKTTAMQNSNQSAQAQIVIHEGKETYSKAYIWLNTILEKRWGKEAAGGCTQIRKVLFIDRDPWVNSSTGGWVSVNLWKQEQEQSVPGHISLHISARCSSWDPANASLVSDMHTAHGKEYSQVRPGPMFILRIYTPEGQHVQQERTGDIELVLSMFESTSRSSCATIARRRRTSEVQFAQLTTPAHHVRTKLTTSKLIRVPEPKLHRFYESFSKTIIPAVTAAPAASTLLSLSLRPPQFSHRLSVDLRPPVLSTQTFGLMDTLIKAPMYNQENCLIDSGLHDALLKTSADKMFATTRTTAVEAFSVATVER
ncbi:hypothetical protein K474DRAFT_1699397 [Panus rudis PR-1116 ss-1]|nr:hypothetical protein K474DRAFT_1699397 [Panus rudis PR-1116 ss-1]